jgi:hypothetical protein
MYWPRRRSFCSSNIPSIARARLFHEVLKASKRQQNQLFCLAGRHYCSVVCAAIRWFLRSGIRVKITNNLFFTRITAPPGPILRFRTYREAGSYRNRKRPVWVPSWTGTRYDYRRVHGFHPSSGSSLRLRQKWQDLLFRPPRPFFQISILVEPNTGVSGHSARASNRGSLVPKCGERRLVVVSMVRVYRTRPRPCLLKVLDDNGFRNLKRLVSAPRRIVLGIKLRTLAQAA